MTIASSKKNRFLFVITTLAIFPLPQLAIDLYLPSLPAMAESLHTQSFLLQLSLTVYILSLGFAQLVYGPCSDRFGRRPVLLVGSLIFLVGSLACTFAHSITQLLIARFVQGIGMGCGFTVASAILGDSFEGQELARMSTFSAMIYSISPILAPVLGGYFQEYIGWRANFAFISLMTVLLFVSIFFFLPETNRHLNLSALKFKNLLLNYSSMLIHLKFFGCMMIMTLAFGIMITFNIVGPFLLQNTLHVSAVGYGQLLLLVGFAYFLGTGINSRLLKFYRVDTLLCWGIGLMLAVAIATVVTGMLGWFTVTSITLWTCLEIFATGFVFPNSFAKALEIFPEMLGTATALIGSLGLILTSVISVVVAGIPVHHQQVLGAMYLVQTILAIFFLFWALRPKIKPAMDAALEPQL